MNLRVGLSGYSYKPWQGEGRFYPVGLKQSEYLDFYADRYDALEVDGTWYRMPGEKQVEDWKAKTPESFTFCFKAHRQVTHMARLKEGAVEPLQEMMRRLKPLGPRLGPVLIQLPPNLKADIPRLDSFFAKLPEAIPHHNQWAVEFRNATWNTPEVEGVLRNYGVAWVASETDETEAEKRDTAAFHYSRLRKSDYANEDLDRWRAYFTGTGKPCHIFCKHEDEGWPWEWADYLLGRK